MAGSGLLHHKPGSRAPCSAPVYPLFNPNLQRRALRQGKLPLPKSGGTKGSQEPLESPIQASDTGRG